MQTYDGSINYVACYATIKAGAGYHWAVETATGNLQQVTNTQVLWTGPTYTNTRATSEQCTIVTNGSTLLQVYMNGTLVYSNTNDNLVMPEPSNAYIEVESSNAAQMLRAYYQDYYSTSSSAVSIEQVTPGDSAEILSGSVVVASGTNDGVSPSTLSFGIGRYEMPLNAEIVVLSGTTVVASTPLTSFWGGDVYIFNDPTTSSSSVKVVSVNQLGQPISGYRTILYASDGETLMEGYTPSTFAVPLGAIYRVSVESYGSCTFAKWSDGATGQYETFFAYGQTMTITAVYDCVAAGRVVASATPVTTVDGLGHSLNNYYVTLWQGGKMLKSYFSILSA